MANTVEELETQQRIKEEEAAEAVEAAGEAAQQAAEAQGLSEEEVQNRVEAARKQEKDKLYAQINELKDLVKEQQEYIRNQQKEQEEEKKRKEEEAEKRRLAKLSEEDRQTEHMRKLEEKLEQSEQARRQFEIEVLENQRKERLEKYKAKVLALAGDSILPQLVDIVRGESEEEINMTLANAKARSEEIINQFRKERGEQVRQGMSTTSPDTEALEEDELKNRISDVDTDRYMRDEEYRDSLKAQIGNEYGRAMGR